MLDEEDLAFEERMWRRGGSSARRDTSGKGKEEMDEPADEFRRPLATTSRTPQKRAAAAATLIMEEDEEDDDAHLSGRRIARGAGTSTKTVGGAIPWRVQEAAALVLDYRDGHLSQRSQDEITMHYLQHPHEFYSVDPLVVLWVSINTGTTRVYCKETVPISLHLLALAFDAFFQLQVAPKMRTSPQGWKETIQIRPCRTAPANENARYPSLGTAEAVREALERAELDLAQVETRVTHYMNALGKLDTRDVCDPDWLEEHTKELRNACMAATHEADNAKGGIKAKLARIGGNL
jgi:hypothetical protein